MDSINGFDTNEFSFTNNSVLKLYDALSVIDYSLKLINEKGRTEFESVIMQQLRMIFLKGNNIYSDKNFEKRGLNKEQNNFSLFDLLKDNNLHEPNGEVKNIRNVKLFPEIKNAHRKYEEIVNSDNKYFVYTNESIVRNNAYTCQEFINQPYISVIDAEKRKSFKSVEQCIKILANKLQGAHYQVHIKKVELDVILDASVISQTLGKITLDVLMPLVQHILLTNDKESNSNNFEKYMNKSGNLSFNVYSATPLPDEESPIQKNN